MHYLHGFIVTYIDIGKDRYRYTNIILQRIIVILWIGVKRGLWEISAHPTSRSSWAKLRDSGIPGSSVGGLNFGKDPVTGAEDGKTADSVNVAIEPLAGDSHGLGFRV